MPSIRVIAGAVIGCLFVCGLFGCLCAVAGLPAARQWPQPPCFERRIRPPVRTGRFGRPVASALLTDWFETRSGKLCLSACGEWLDPPWHRVPLPLPLRSVNALALFLFLHAVKVDGNAEEERAIALDKLCDQLGIPYWRPALDKRRVDAALAIVNQHLDDLDLETRRALMRLRPPLVVPARYKIFARRRGTRICFTREEFKF
jgi:hypothetical protein